MVITELLKKTAKATRVAHVLTTNVIRVLIKVDRFAMAQAKKTPKRVLPAITEDLPTHALPEIICQEVLVRKCFILIVAWLFSSLFFSPVLVFFSFRSGKDNTGDTQSCYPCNVCPAGTYNAGTPCTGMTTYDTQSCPVCAYSVNNVYTCPAGYYPTGTACDGTGGSDSQTCGLTILDCVFTW